MLDVILPVLMLLSPVVPPILAFRYVFTGRAGRGWLMPIAVAGVGLGLILWLEWMVVSAQSQLFAGLLFLAVFGFATALTIVACLLGHAARLIAAGRHPKAEG
jgi:hypothetical protein